jgi:sugar phosphate isomerase/epimerase
MMELVFCKSKWEMWHDPLEAFLDRTAAHGFDATELYLATVSESPGVIERLHNDRGLAMIGQILTEGSTAAEHIDSLDRYADVALEAGASLVNLHAGRDIFSFSDNLRIFEAVIDMGNRMGVPFVVETHRGRPTYSAVETRRYLEALPELRLTADFSHWMVVHESDLSDQDSNIQLAIERSLHIHARVGYAEGPQVPDPRAPEWNGHVDRHIDLWRRILKVRQLDGMDRVTITPEFGPPDYMHTIPFTGEPVADTWDVNVFMQQLLRERLVTGSGGAPRDEG